MQNGPANWSSRPLGARLWKGLWPKNAIRPTVRAATTIAGFDQSLDDLDLTTLVEKLAEQVSAVQGGDLSRAEEMLIAQAHTLDLIFHQLLQRSMKNINAGCLEPGETFMRLALRTQSQCRSTLETLSAVKNPPAVALVHQANIAHGPQQVNNGSESSRTDSAPSRAREYQPNELLEQQRNARMDSRAPQATIGADSAMATVGTVNGSKQSAG